ncbi:MAG: hypothetical protein WC732_09675 [Candidatus Omnitrophota bacterium]
MCTNVEPAPTVPASGGTTVLVVHAQHGPVALALTRHLSMSNNVIRFGSGIAKNFALRETVPMYVGGATGAMSVQPDRNWQYGVDMSQGVPEGNSDEPYRHT